MRRGAGLLRANFPFRAYINRLEQPHCLRNMRVSSAQSNHTATVTPRQNRNEADFFHNSHATNPLHVCHPDSGWKQQVLGMQRNFKLERAWSDFTGVGWNCRWAGSGIGRSGLLRLWAVEQGERTPTWAGSGNSHRSAPLTCSDLKMICLGLIHTKPALPIQYLFSCSAVNTALSQEMRANIKTTETDIKKDVAFMTDQYVVL